MRWFGRPGERWNCGLFPPPQPVDEINRSLASASSFVVAEPISLQELERRYVQWMASQPGGDRTALARRLGVGTRTLYRKLSRAHNATGAGFDVTNSDADDEG